MYVYIYIIRLCISYVIKISVWRILSALGGLSLLMRGERYMIRNVYKYMNVYAYTYMYIEV
jgi:hypothetical protein